MPDVKHLIFVSSPVLPCTLVDVLPGIEGNYAEKLRQNGFCYAWQVLLVYLWFNEDMKHFNQWLANICMLHENECWPMKEQWMDQCYFGLYSWCRQYLLPSMNTISPFPTLTYPPIRKPSIVVKLWPSWQNCIGWIFHSDKQSRMTQLWDRYKST